MKIAKLSKGGKIGARSPNIFRVCPKFFFSERDLTHSKSLFWAFKLIPFEKFEIFKVVEKAV